MRSYYFCGIAYKKIIINNQEEEYTECFEKIIKTTNKKEAILLLKQELFEFDKIEIQTSYSTSNLAMI